MLQALYLIDVRPLALCLLPCTQARRPIEACRIVLKTPHPCKQHLLKFEGKASDYVVWNSIEPKQKQGNLFIDQVEMNICTTMLEYVAISAF